MTEFQQWIKEIYLDIKESCRREDGSYDTQAEDEVFMDMFNISDNDYAGRTLSAVHCDHWDMLENLVESLYADYRICLMSAFEGANPEEILI